MEITEKDIDQMLDAEQQFQEEESRMTPREKLLRALELQQRCIDNIKDIVENLGKV